MGSIVVLKKEEKIVPLRLSFVTEFTNLIRQKVPFNNSKKKEFSFPPGSAVFQTDYPTSKNHHPADQDLWDEKAQTIEFARRKFGK